MAISIKQPSHPLRRRRLCSSPSELSTSGDPRIETSVSSSSHLRIGTRRLSQHPMPPLARRTPDSFQRVWQ
jgi:hypothetical protein